MEQLDLDLSFLAFRDEVDKAKDAAKHWQEFTARRRSPLIDNMKEWAELTEDIPAGQKPKFEDLSQLLTQRFIRQKKEKDILKEIYRKANKERIKQNKINEKFKRNSKKQFENKRLTVLKQKQNRDNFIKNLQLKKYQVPPRDNKLDNVHIFPIEPIVEVMTKDLEHFSEDKYISRPKTNQEIYQDILDINNMKYYGNETKARCETLHYLIQLGIDLNNINTIVKIQYHFDDPEFETKAYDFETTEIVTETIPQIIKTNETIEIKMKEEFDRKISEEIRQFNESTATESKQHTNIVTQIKDHDIFAEMDAWLRIHYKNISREEKEKIEKIKEIAPQKLNLVKIKDKVKDIDNHDTTKQWEIEEKRKKLNECKQKIKEIEINYIICSWLLKMDFVKHYILSHVENNNLNPQININDNIVLQIEMYIFLFEHSEINRTQLESSIDYFLNVWLKTNETFLKPTQEIESCQILLLKNLHKNILEVLDCYGPHLIIQDKQLQNLKVKINSSILNKYEFLNL